MKVGMAVPFGGFVGIVTAITHNDQVFWLQFPKSVCSEPFTQAQIDEARRKNQKKIAR